MSTKTNSTSSARVYYLDYLRAFIILVVIIHHSLLPYVIGFDWTINDAVKTFPYTLACNINDVFMMPIMFFIAGYFAFPSIKKGVKNFISNKVIHILLPFFIGITFLAPIISYLGAIHRGIINVSFTYYWSNVYFKYFINPHHFWFLSSLFFFFMVFSLVYSLMKNKLESIYEKSQLNPVSLTSIILFVILFLAISILLFYYAGRKYPDGSWYGGYKFIVFQITRWTEYILYFTMGVIVFIKRIEFSNKFLKFVPLLIFVTILSTLIFCVFKFQIYYSPDMGLLKANIQFYNAIVHVIYCFIIFIMLMTFFKKYLNRPLKVLSRLASNSYVVYIVHMVYTILIQYYIFDMQIHIFYKFLITIIGTIIMSLVTSKIILKLISISPFSKANGSKFLSKPLRYSDKNL